MGIKGEIRQATAWKSVIHEIQIKMKTLVRIYFVGIKARSGLDSTVVVHKEIGSFHDNVNLRVKTKKITRLAIILYKLKPKISTLIF